LLSHDRIGTDPVQSPPSVLPGSGLPIFRIAHPAVLQAQPEFKRHAWTELKAIRKALA